MRKVWRLDSIVRGPLANPILHTRDAVTMGSVEPERQGTILSSSSGSRAYCAHRSLAGLRAAMPSIRPRKLIISSVNRLGGPLAAVPAGSDRCHWHRWSPGHVGVATQFPRRSTLFSTCRGHGGAGRLTSHGRRLAVLSLIQISTDLKSAVMFRSIAQTFQCQCFAFRCFSSFARSLPKFMG